MNTPQPSPRPSRTSGPGRILIGVYALFFLAAAARAAVQLATQFHEAPIAYLLSAVAALIYGFSTFSLSKKGPVGWRMARIAAIVEITGVVVIGTISILAPADFPQATVWSYYGIGYGLVPLALPVLALLWLQRTREI